MNSKWCTILVASLMGLRCGCKVTKNERFQEWQLNTYAKQCTQIDKYIKKDIHILKHTYTDR